MEEQGPFDRVLQEQPPERRDRTATVIVAATIALGLILLILVLPPISIFDGGNDDRPPGDVSAVIRDELPPPPEGFEAVNLSYDLSVPGTERPPGQHVLTVPLSSPVDQGERLWFYTYRDGNWERLGHASPNSTGTFAQGEMPSLPENVAVLRPTSKSHIVLGNLPPGATPDSRALATLTTLNPAGFAPSSDGGVFGDRSLIPSDAPVPVAPTISAHTPEEIATLNAILASPELRAAHVQAILRLALDSDVAGIDLDYPSIDSALGGEFSAFVQDLSTALKEANRNLTLTLPPPAEQDGEWDTLGFDWETLVPLVEAVKLAPPPEPEEYHARMERALAYLTSRVTSSKLLLTVGPLSRERGIDGVRTLMLREALTLASTPVADLEGTVAPGTTVQAMGQNLAEETGASGLYWDDTARAVAFSYAGPGGERTVWFANEFSEAFKLDLARRHGLGGVAVESVSRRAAEANIWPVLRGFAQTGEVSLIKPNGELLQPRWTASGGSLETDTGAQVTWLAPAESGAYTLTLIVSDGVIRVGQQLQLTVEPAQGAIAP